MKQRIISMILLAGLVTMLAGCAETFNKKTSSQGSISVSAFGGLDTKTNYSGEFYEEIVNNVTHKYERIDWVAGDSIRIYSTDKTQVGVGVVNHASDISDHYDYEIYDVKDPVDKKSNATLKKPAEGQGLTWINDPYGIYFCGTYPPVDALYDNQGGAITKFHNMSIPSTQTGTPDMKHAYMLAVPAQYVASDKVDDHGVKIPHMHMDFYPLFNAFYIELQCESGSNPIILESIVLSSSSDNLSGTFYYNIGGTIGSDDDNLSHGPVVSGVVHDADLSNSVTADLSSISVPDRTITDSKSVNVTLLALPPQDATAAIKNMTLTINYHNSGQTTSKSAQLDFMKGSDFITFPAFHKARITGLAMKGGNIWSLTIDGEALPWDRTKDTTTFAQNIQSGPFEIENAKEGEGNNYYPEGTKEYQVRTLDMDNGKTYFIVTFKPAAPLGGYWQLIPESVAGMGTAAFKVEVWDEEDDVVGSSDLKGQIMNKDVVLHITSNVSDDQRTENHEIILKAIFSSSVSFDENSAFSADSEVQDVHKDGSFSYWLFRIPAKNN